MSPINKSRRGLRATIGISIAIVAFSAFPLSRNLGQPSKQQQLIPETEPTSLNTTDSTWRLVNGASEFWPQLAPRELPDGITLSFSDAKCKGEANLAQLNGAGNQKAADVPIDHLEGWHQQAWEDDEIDGSEYGALEKLLKGSTSKAFGVTAYQNKPYHDIRGELRVSSGCSRSCVLSSLVLFYFCFFA